MPDNPRNSESHPPMVESTGFALSDHGVLSLEGPQAVAFAQAQFMNDVQALPEGDWHWNGWLTPKGRVIALFALLRPAPDTVWLLLPDADTTGLTDLVERLRRYVFRSKLTITVRDDLHVTGRFAALEDHAGDAGGAPQPLAHNRIVATAGGGVALDMGGDAGPRRLQIGPARAADDAGALARWRALDLRHGWPRLEASQREQWTPQQLSLDRLQAFSVKKGCYPGQEIVARTHFLGQSKRGLGLIETGTPMAPGEPVIAAGETLGTVVSRADGLALAVHPLERVPAEAGEATGAVGAEATPDTTRPAQGGASWRLVPLAGGLAR